MEAGNVSEFVDNLTMQDEIVRFNNHLYYFYGIRYDEDKKCYYVSIDKFGGILIALRKNFIITREQA